MKFALALFGISTLNFLCACFAVAAEPRPTKIPLTDARNTRFSERTKTVAFRGLDKARAESPLRYDQNSHAQPAHAGVRNVKFTHLTTNDGLSQAYVTAILQDRRGFIWFATRNGLNRYDGNTFLVYKHNPNDPASLSSNFIQDLIEDDQGYLWTATNTGVNKFDPTTERSTRYVHDPKFAAEGPRFQAAVWEIFNPYELRGYVASAKPSARRKTLQKLLYVSSDIVFTPND